MEIVRYEGDVYRPPSEAYSLIVQATIGCSNNTCAFCRMYKAKRFRLRALEDVLEDLRRARVYRKVEKIFIADGDALIQPMDRWEQILSLIANLYPECKSVTCYATPKSILLKSDEELLSLHRMGLKMVYVGLESGSEKVLAKMHKGNTAAQAVEAAQKIHKSGIKLSVTAINGLGGLEDSEEHAVCTGKVLSQMKPEYIGLLTLMLDEDLPICNMIAKKELTLLNAEEILGEIRTILQNCDSEGSIFRANHASNYLPLKGTLNGDTPRLIALIDSALEGKTNLRPEWMRAL